MSVKVTKDNTKAFHQSLAKLVKSRVLVGVPYTTASREPEPGETGPPINNAALAYIQNYGSPANNIPARPFMEPGIKDAQARITKLYETGAKGVLDNPTTDPNVTHEKVGLVAQTAIQNKINDGPFTPLAESTLAAREAKGQDSTDPLKNTLQLLKSINYVVRERS